MDPVPKSLGAKLRELDAKTPRTRIFIMGCGRSGTGLLTGIMSTFDDVFLLAKEGPLERFAAIEASEFVHVIKRDHLSSGWVNLVPPEIGILAIVRHPFDVMTSHMPGTEQQYHIPPLRWNVEMQALRWLIETKRPKTLIVRFEDLVADPESQQSAIAKFFSLRVRVPAKEFTRTFRIPEITKIAMRGLREPDINSVGRWKRDPDAVSYLATLVPDLRPQLDWISAQFGYDTGL